ncbi:hypothetical protein [Stutzerimonas nitrititolerans]|uniref:hypothetical protein n=1 Tax=Stutzerimonas nitrititolerans TaxID=2482751 RepID=UPI002896E12B|nr:hypothetical protein [Stutzerimonas nitrititolerans]
MSTQTSNGTNLGRDEKIQLIKNYLSFLENSGSQYDCFLDLLMQVRGLNQAICDIYKSSEALGLVAKFSADLFKVLNTEIGEFEREQDFMAGAYSYLNEQEPAHRTSPDYYDKLQSLPEISVSDLLRSVRADKHSLQQENFRRLLLGKDGDREGNLGTLQTLKVERVGSWGWGSNLFYLDLITKDTTVHWQVIFSPHTLMSYPQIEELLPVD